MTPKMISEWLNMLTGAAFENTLWRQRRGL